jgi:hypothetical protein
VLRRLLLLLLLLLGLLLLLVWRRLRECCKGRLLLDEGLLQLPTRLLDQHRLHGHLLHSHMLPRGCHQHLLLWLLVRQHPRRAAAAIGAAGRLHQHAQLAAGAGAVARHAAVADAAKAVLRKQQHILAACLLLDVFKHLLLCLCLLPIQTFPVHGLRGGQGAGPAQRLLVPGRLHCRATNTTTAATRAMCRP